MENAKQVALDALRLMFRPVARILLRAGITWRELAEVCKLTLVEVATEEFGIRGRPTNISRVAIMTGISRREVRRLRDRLEDASVADFTRMNSATRVLSGWFTDPDFSMAGNSPLPLGAAGESPSFEALCARYCGDVAPSTMLKELKRVGAVEESADGTLSARMRVYMPVHMDPEQVLTSGSVLEDLGDTVAYNLHREEGDLPRFERRATNTEMPARVVPEFKDFLDREGQAFLERVDAWLSEHEDTKSDSQVRLGLGTYWIQSTKR